MACRETELVGNVPREAKEVVAASVSNLNNCPYCVDAHTIMLDAAGQKKTANAVSNNRCGNIPDSKLRSIAEWALATGSPKSPILFSPPFTRQDAPEFIGTAVFYHYMNRMVTVLLGATPLPSNQRWLRGPMKRIASRIFQSAVQSSKHTGDALQFLPKANLPVDMQWAKTAPKVAWAYSCFASAVEKAGENALPLEVRAHVQEEVREWDGKTTELSLAWTEDSLSRFDTAKQSAARLALLTALAPSKTDENIISSFRKHFPGDDMLLGALAWASLAAARKIGSWLPLPMT
jgi:AhpD family alkylhydroperoxidase